MSPLLQEKQLTVLTGNDKIKLQAKIRILYKFRVSTNHYEFDSFLILENLSKETGSDSGQCNILVVYNKMCQHLEDHNLINQD